MAEYFLLLDAHKFTDEIRPALAAAWVKRRFQACQSLCTDLIPAYRNYADRYRTGTDEPLLIQVSKGLGFDQLRWRTLAGEILLFAALEIPEFQVNADTLCALLAPNAYQFHITQRCEFAPIQQAHLGSRDLRFGPAVYRPEHAGYNNPEDVARLADYLAGVHPEDWSEADLAILPDADQDDRAEELAFAQEWFPALVELYQNAHRLGRVVIHESIY